MLVSVPRVDNQDINKPPRYKQTTNTACGGRRGRNLADDTAAADIRLAVHRTVGCSGSESANQSTLANTLQTPPGQYDGMPNLPVQLPAFLDT